MESSTSVLRVTAADPDGSDSLTYDIIQSASSVGSSYFTINPGTGEISTAGTLDREEVSIVDLQVIATDSAGLNVRIFLATSCLIHSLIFLDHRGQLWSRSPLEM